MADPQADDLDERLDALRSRVRADGERVRALRVQAARAQEHARLLRARASTIADQTAAQARRLPVPPPGAARPR